MSGSVSWPRRCPPLALPFQSFALGVGHILTKSVSVVPLWCLLSVDLFAVAFAVLLWSFITGVGTFCKAPPPLAQVRSASIGSGYNRPARVIPQRGQVSDDGPDVSGINDAWHVFQKRKSRSYSANDPACVRPQITLVSFSLSLPSDRMRLAREPRMDAIHSSLVFGWIKQPNISFPHMQVWKPSVFCSLPQDLAAVFIPLNSDN